MTEVWKDVEGFEGFYQISNYGRLKSFKQLREGRILSLNNKNGTYLSVILTAKNKEPRSTRMHRLVSEAFISNPDSLPEVNHKDCNRQNNHVDNLEWVTHEDNMQHALANHKGMFDGMITYNKHVRPKPIAMVDKRTGAILKVFDTGSEAAKATGVCGRNILQVANKTEYKPGLTRKQAGGYIWRFA